MQEKISNIIELHFPLKGESLPSDHAYTLYSAISKLIPEVHNASWLGIHTVKGHRLRDRVIELGSFAKLRLRLPAAKAPNVCALAGQKLDISGHPLICGIPSFNVLRPSARLRSRFVMIKPKGSEGKSADEKSFLESLRRQIDQLEISAEVSLEKNVFPKGADGALARRALRVRSVTLTGYGVILDRLNERDSLIVQEVGLGGKRRMGCGLFEPFRRDIE